ncbi:MAG: arsenic resistance N-acetyltransferase ArsN2 [Rubricoccaceae bacterium]|nr:arsenic resistance N-acetyltransferase ArsN2 [Rubricoccaceae bacterium]
MNIAAPSDFEAVAALLKSADLCYEDLTPAHMAHFLAERDGEQLIGTVGLEVTGTDALLRSLVVSPEHRGSGLGVQLVDDIETLARKTGVKNLFLLTTTADGFFDKRGYERIERSSVPAAIAATTEFKTFCPDSAACMQKRLG